MSYMILAVIFIAVIASVFAFLQFLSNRKYRPSKEDVQAILQSTIEGRLDLRTYDEFSNVRIAYDKRLEVIRRRFNLIVNDTKNIPEAARNKQSNPAPLNESGKKELTALLAELE